MGNGKKPVKRMCAGLLAHVDAGKTTLSEALLYQSGAIRRTDGIYAAKTCVQIQSEVPQVFRLYEYRFLLTLPFEKILNRLFRIRKEVLIGGNQQKVSQLKIVQIQRP